MEPTPVYPPPQRPPAKKGLGMGCKVAIGCLLGLVLLAVAAGIVAFITVRNVYTFFANAAEAAPMALPPVQLAKAEANDLDRKLAQLASARDEKADVDLTFSPQQLNTFWERELAKTHAPSQDTPVTPVVLRAGFEGPQTVLRASTRTDDGKYLNLELRGQLGIENHQLKWQLDGLKVGGREAPWAVKWTVRWILDAMAEEAGKPGAATGTPLDYIRTLRREGDAFRLQLDGLKLPPPDDEAPGQQVEGF